MLKFYLESYVPFLREPAFSNYTKLEFLLSLLLLNFPSLSLVCISGDPTVFSALQLSREVQEMSVVQKIPVMSPSIPFLTVP